MPSINPFPVPAEVLRALGEEALRVILPEPLPGRRPGQSPPEPAFVDAFDTWHVQTEGSIEGLLNLALGLRPSLSDHTPQENIEWDFLTNGIEALGLRLKQFDVLLHWARHTWSYDPAIQAAMDQQPGPASEESAVSSDARALQ